MAVVDFFAIQRPDRFRISPSREGSDECGRAGFALGIYVGRWNRMSDDVIHTLQNKFLEGGFPLDRHQLGALKQVIWEINRGFHEAINTAIWFASRGTRVSTVSPP